MNNIDCYCDDILINKRQIKQRLSCNAGQAEFLAASWVEILAGGGAKPTSGGAELPLPLLTLTTECSVVQSVLKAPP